MKTKLDIYTRDDREPLSQMVKGLGDVLLFCEALEIAEKYGLSVVFNEAEIEWTCRDPKKYYEGTANTITGAIYFWDYIRQKFEGKNEDPKLKLVETQTTHTPLTAWQKWLRKNPVERQRLAGQRAAFDPTAGKLAAVGKTLGELMQKLRDEGENPARFVFVVVPPP